MSSHDVSTHHMTVGGSTASPFSCSQAGIVAVRPKLNSTTPISSEYELPSRDTFDKCTPVCRKLYPNWIKQEQSKKNDTTCTIALSFMFINPIGRSMQQTHTYPRERTTLPKLEFWKGRQSSPLEGWMRTGLRGQRMQRSAKASNN